MYSATSGGSAGSRTWTGITGTSVADNLTYDVIPYFWYGFGSGGGVSTMTEGTATYYGVVGQTVTSYPSRRLTGYALFYTENLPLELSANSAQNVINVYYRTANRLLTLNDLAVPLGFSGGSLEVGVTAE